MALTIGLRIALDPWLHGVPYITIFGAVIVAAWYGGVGPALAAAAAGYVGAHFLFIEAFNAVELLAYSLSTGLIAALGGARQRASLRERASEVRFRTFMEHAPAAVFLKDEAGRYVYMNAAAQNVVGATDWLGRTDAELLPAATAEEIGRHDREVLAADASRTFSLDVSGPEGPRHFYSTKFPLRNAAGERFVGAVTIDLTQQQRSAEELRSQREQLRLVTDSLSAGVLRVSRDLKFVWVNRVYAGWIGKSPEEIAGRPIAEILGEDGLKALRPHIERLLAGQRVEYERLAHFPRVGQRWVYSVGEPTRDAAGMVDGWVALVSDIHERREATEALDAAREQLQLVADSMPAAVALCSRDLRFIWVNRRCASWLGSTPQAVAGRPMVDVIGKDNLAAIRPHLERVLGGEQVAYERLVRYPGMGERWVRNVFSPAQPGETWIAVITDIHEQKLLEERLRDSDRRKDEFLGTLAHELRNPLAPLRNAVTILERKGALDAELAWSRQLIERQVDELARLIDHLLEIARIANGKLTLRKARVALERVLEMAIEASRPRMDAAGQRLVLRLPSEPVSLEADAPRLAHAFSQLIDHVARRSRQGAEIALSVDARSGEALACVRADNHDEAADATRLALVRGIVALHGGHLETKKSAGGKASELLVHLPLAPASPEAKRARAPATQASGPGTRILIADDNRDAADSLQRILALYGYDVRVAYDGVAAMRLGEDFEPAVAVLDIGMPGASGYEVARHLRGWRGSAIKLIAVTGWGQEGDRRHAIEAGFDYHLTKPVEPSALQALLAEVPAE